MIEKKKLKKLVLKKEEIVNLNDFQMGQAKGGASTKKCGQIASGIFSLIHEAYGHGKDNSWWDCGMGNISKKIVNLPDGSQACEIPEVDIYGYRP